MRGRLSVRRQDRKTSIQERGKNKMLEPKVIYPYLSKPFVFLLVYIVYAFFPADEMHELLSKSIDISKSAHLVNRSDANEPNGSTCAPVCAKS